MVGVQGVGAFLNRRNARGRRRGGSAGAASRLLGTQAGKQTESGEGQSEHWEHPEESIVCRLQWHFGLIARDLLVHNYNNVLADHPVVGLITLGTPNWGYPYIPADATVRCPAQVQDMNGGWNPYVNDPSTAFLSPFLTSLKQGWSSSSYGGYWFAAAGTNCPNPFRVGSVGFPAPPTGCLYSASGGSIDPNNDGVVCRDSAIYSANSCTRMHLVVGDRRSSFAQTTHRPLRSFSIPIHATHSFSR
jgi:hypothetical protein